MEERKDMSMQNQVVTVVSMMGELCGRIKDETDTTVTLESPRLFVPGQDASGGGFAPGASMTGAQDLKEATFNKSVILTIIPAHESIVKGWVEYTSGIIV
jgi:hypothetical protein